MYINGNGNGSGNGNGNNTIFTIVTICIGYYVSMRHYYGIRLLKVTCSNTHSQQTQNICITFYNVGPTSSTLVQHCTNVIQIFSVYWENWWHDISEWRSSIAWLPSLHLTEFPHYTPCTVSTTIQSWPSIKLTGPALPWRLGLSGLSHHVMITARGYVV